jgi:hypothetical protein
LKQYNIKTKLAKLRPPANYTKQQPLVGEVNANFFADRVSHVVSVTDPLRRILGFLRRNRYFIFQVAPQFYSRS